MSLLNRLLGNEEPSLPTLTKKEGIILQMLATTKELFGLEMVKQSRELKRGTVYVTLNRLEEKGFIESQLKEQEKGLKGPARRVYCITGFGSRVLSAWESHAQTLAHLQGGT